MRKLLKFIYGLTFGLLLFGADTTPASAGNYKSGYPDRKIQYNCKSNGKCCEALNNFWRNRMMKDFKLGKSGVAKYDLQIDKINCPSSQSFHTEAFKFLYDFSHSKSAELNYYEWAKNTIQESGYTIYVEPMRGSFAQTQHNFKAIVFLDFWKHSTVFTAAHIVHEATHVYSSDSKHVICSQGQLKGKENCDESLDLNNKISHLSYSNQFHFINNLANTTKGKTRSIAKKISKAIYKNQINNPPKYGPDGKTPFLKYYRLK